MFFAYMDESGDPGVGPGSPTPTYTVATVLIHETHWIPLFEDMLQFRRWLKTNFGLLMRLEVKATELARGSGPWHRLGHGDEVRRRVYRSFMRLQRKTGRVRTFAVVTDKRGYQSPDQVVESTWRQAFERIERFATKNQELVLLIPDLSGASPQIRKLARKMRRHNFVGSMLGTEPLSRPLAGVLLEDPLPKRSHESYFLQLADLNAYAAYRRIVPVAGFPQNMWHELGDREAILWEANRYSGGPAGIVRDVAHAHAPLPSV